MCTGTWTNNWARSRKTAEHISHVNTSSLLNEASASILIFNGSASGNPLDLLSFSPAVDECFSTPYRLVGTEFRLDVRFETVVGGRTSDVMYSSFDSLDLIGERKISSKSLTTSGNFKCLRDDSSSKSMSSFTWWLEFFCFFSLRFDIRVGVDSCTSLADVRVIRVLVFRFPSSTGTRIFCVWIIFGLDECCDCWSGFDDRFRTFGLLFFTGLVLMLLLLQLGTTNESIDCKSLSMLLNGLMKLSLNDIFVSRIDGDLILIGSRLIGSRFICCVFIMSTIPYSFS